MDGDFDIAVIGGGFFGAYLALHAARDLGASVLVLEREPGLLRRASWVNQARVHGGYHYPRSLVTGARSHANYARFMQEFGDCTETDFVHLYAVATRFSKVTARQFERFCGHIEAPLRAAPPEYARLFDRNLIEAVWVVEETAFDAARLATRMQRELADAGVTVQSGTEVLAVRAAGAGLDLQWRRDGADGRTHATHVFNCTYSRLNQIGGASGFPVIPLKHELTELALIRVPEPLRRVGITVMCGPFFSCMPFPARSMHSLSHVRYTPHRSWADEPSADRLDDPYAVFARSPRSSRFVHMVRDAARYVPSLADARYEESIWEVKTVLPQNEVDDGRPILFRTDHGAEGYHCVMGSKIDNVYDVLDAFRAALRGETVS